MDGGSSQGGSGYDQSSVGSRDRGSEAASSAAGISNGGQDGYNDKLGSRVLLADSVFNYIGAAEKLSIEKSWKLQGLILLYQVVFLGIYAMHPMWGYKISWDNPIGRWALRIQGHGWATVSRDPKVLTGLALCAIVVTVLHALLALHVGLVVRRGKTVPKAELVIARLFELFYYKVFGLPALGVLLAPLSCNWSGQLAGKASSNIFLHSSQCTGTLTILGLGGLAVAVILHAPMYILLAVKDCELNPMTPVPFSGGSMPAIARIAVLKVVSLLVLHLLTGVVPVLSAVIIVLLWAWAVYVTVMRLPYLGHAHSRFRAFCAGAIAGGFVASAVQVGGHNAVVVLAVLAPVGGLAAQWRALARMRGAVAVVAKFKEIRKTLVQTDERVHKYFDQEDPELIVRSLRKTDAQRVVDPEDMGGCFSAVNHALSHFPDSAEAVLAMAIVQAFGQNDVHSAHSSVQKARGMPVSLSVRVELLTLEKELRKRQSSTSGDSMDWSTYVELQNRLRVIVQTHKKAIETSRDVWKALLKSEIGIDDVAAALRRMDKHESAAEAVYKAMISRHSTYPKLLQMYGKFLEDLQDNTGLAMQYFQEAERLEDAAAARNEAAQAEETAGEVTMKDRPSLTNIDEARDSVVVIDPEGVINFTNGNMTKLFGYKRGELVGRNVSTLMPQPFSQQHDRFVKNYTLTGQPRILNRVMPFVALHQTGILFPITACITKISQNGRDGFMGVIRARETDDSEAVLYLSASCQVVSVTKPFVSLCGWNLQQLQAQEINVLFPDEAGLRATMGAATQECGDEAPPSFKTHVQSRFGERFDARVLVTWVGSNETRLFILRVARTSEEPPLVVLGPHSEILSHNTAFKRLCGQNEKTLLGAGIAKVLAYPCAAIFGSRLDKLGDDAQARAAAIDQKIVRIPWKNAQGFVYSQITLLSKGEGEDGEPQFTFRFQYLERGAEDHAAVTLSVDGQGVVTDATQHCQCTTPAFGFTSEGLTGQPLNKVILMRGPMEPFMSAWVEATRAPPFQSESQLVSVRHANGSMRFGIAYFNADYELVGQGRDAKPVGEPSLSITLYCLDFLPVVLDMHDDTSIRHVYGSIRLLSGQSGEELTTRPGASVLPQLFRQAGRSADALLLLPGQRRAASNKHKHVVGSEQYSEGMSGPLGVKVTCQAARIQGTKDTVMMLLEPTGPSPGPVKAPVARAFVPGLDDVHVQRAGRKGKEGAAAEGGEAEGAAAEGAAGQDAKQDGAAEQGEDGAGQVAAAAVESGHDAAGAEGATAGAAGAEGGADEKGKDNGLMRGAAEGREGEGSQEGKAPAGEAGTEPPRVSRYTAGGRLSGSSHGDSDEEGGGGERQGFAYQRMKDWVDHDGSTHKQSMGPAELFTEPASLTGAAISRLQESLLQAGRADSAGVASPAVLDSGRQTVQAAHASAHGAAHASAHASAHAAAPTRQVSGALSGEEEPAAEQPGKLGRADSICARHKPTRMASGTRLVAKRDHEDEDDDVDDGAVVATAAPAPGKLGSSEEKTKSDDGGEDLVDSQSQGDDEEGREDAVGGGDSDKDAHGGEDGMFVEGAKKGLPTTEASKRESGESSRKSSASAMSEGVGEGPRMVVEGEEDMGGLELLEHETAQARSRKFKRVYGMLSSQVMMRPVTIARLTMLVVSMVIIVVQCIGFSQILLRVLEHNKLSAYVQKAGAALKDIVDMKRYARLLQGLSVGTPIPDSSLERNQQLFLSSTNNFLDAHNALYHTATMFKDKKCQPQFKDIWLTMNLGVTDLTTSSFTLGGATKAVTTNLWEAGNTYASYGLELAKMGQADISQGDIAPLASFQYLKDNGLVIIAGRYEELLGTLVSVTKANLLQMGVVAIVFLAVNLGVVVPIGLVLIHRGISASLRVRASMMSILVAVPRRLLLEMSRRPINLEMLDELAERDEEEDSAEKNAMAVTQTAGISSKAMRVLLSQRVDYERVKVVRDQVMARRSKQRTQQMIELFVVGPFVLWAAAAGALYGVTWTLQSNTSVRLEPSRVAYIMSGYTAKTMCSTTDLVVDTINRLNGSQWATASGPVKSRLAINQAVVESAVEALIWGNKTFMGQYNVPGGTVVFNPVLRDIYFTHQCFSEIQCVPETDPSWPSVGRGYFAIMSRFIDQASALPDDRDVDLTVNNVRYQFLQANGDDSIRVAQARIQASTNTVNATITTIVALHVLLLVGTIASGVCFTVFLLRPLRRLLAMESMRLSHLMAELPKELAIEEAVVALVEEIVSSGHQEDALMDMAHDGAPREGADGAKDGQAGEAADEKHK